MRNLTNIFPTIYKLIGSAAVTLALLTIGAVPSYCQKNETIEASAMATGTQLGQMREMRLVIYDYSSPDERQILVDAFNKGQNQGLVNALSKMRAVGRISLPGTLGYDVSYIRVIPTSTGRKIRFITNRQITFGEAWTDSRSQNYDLTGGELDLNDSDKSKSTGALYPAAKLVIDQAGQLQIDLNQNSWKLSNILDWAGTPGVN
jgi:hypothetical protein